MSRPEVDGLNTGYAALMLEQYLDNPSAVPTEWPSRGPPRPARLGAARRSRARARAPDPEADARADVAHSGAAPSALRRRPDARRRVSAPARDLLRLDRVRDRAPLRPRGARVAPPGDRVRPLPAAAERGGATAPARPAQP